MRGITDDVKAGWIICTRTRERNITTTSANINNIARRQIECISIDRHRASTADVENSNLSSLGEKLRPQRFRVWQIERPSGWHRSSNHGTIEISHSQIDFAWREKFGDKKVMSQ